MKVDQNIVNALEEYFLQNKTGCAEFAAKLEVSPAALTKWRRIGSGITTERWKKVFPLIKEFLPADRIYIDSAGKEQYSSNSEIQQVHKLEHTSIMVPSFSIDKLSQYDDTLESIIQFATTLNVNYVEYRPKHLDKSNVFSIFIDNDKMAPIIPQKTRLFVCAGERPQSGGLVLVSTSEKNTFLGFYTQKGDNFSITKVGESEANISGKMKNARNMITWIFPVLYYEVITF